MTRPPKNTQPDSCGIFNPGSTTFSWDGPTVSNIKYDVFIDGLGYVAKDLLTRNFTYNITNVGTYTWHVEAYDGIKRQIGETWKFTVEAENFFPIYNVNGKIIRKIPTTLFNSIKSSLINNDRPDDANKLAASYNISLNNDDNKGFAFSLLYPSNMEDGRTFEYAAYRHGGWSYNRATGNIWDQEGEDCDGNTSDEYIKRIYLRKNSSNLGILPDIQFDCHYQKVGSDFTRGGNWDEEIRTTGDDNPIDQIRCAVKGCYNVWYNMRSEGQAHSVGWKSNGDWCGNDIDEYKMVLYRMFILRY